jgi:hypothetical protein
MKKKVKSPEMRAEYDFSKGVRGKYLQRLAEQSHVVALDPDVAAHFPDSRSVNDALRRVAGLPPPKRPRRRSY